MASNRQNAQRAPVSIHSSRPGSDGSDDACPRPRIFLLSPANCSGKRAGLLFSERASFDLATRLRSEQGAELGEVFAFISGLYFRGKLAYGQRFAVPPTDQKPSDSVLVITPCSGLLPADTRVNLEVLRTFRGVDIDEAEPRYRLPLERDLQRLGERIGGGSVVLLGSIATGKYTEVITGLLESRLLFPKEFVGRGDMSRGGLLLRCARAGAELDYTPIADAVRHGVRPPRLAPIRRGQ